MIFALSHFARHSYPSECCNISVTTTLPLSSDSNGSRLPLMNTPLCWVDASLAIKYAPGCAFVQRSFANLPTNGIFEE